MVGEFQNWGLGNAEVRENEEDKIKRI